MPGTVLRRRSTAIDSAVGEIGSFTNHNPDGTPAHSYEEHEEWREKRSVADSEAHAGFYVLTRYADVRAAAKDWQTYSSADGFTLPPQPIGPSLFNPIRRSIRSSETCSRKHSLSIYTAVSRLTPSMPVSS